MMSFPPLFARLVDQDPIFYPYNRRSVGQALAAKVALDPENWGHPEGENCVSCHEKASPGLAQQWHDSAHKRAGVNCMDCHQAEPRTWTRSSTRGRSSRPSSRRRIAGAATRRSSTSSRARSMPRPMPSSRIGCRRWPHNVTGPRCRPPAAISATARRSRCAATARWTRPPGPTPASAASIRTAPRALARPATAGMPSPRPRRASRGLRALPLRAGLAG
jgi:hypothetical protein